MATTNNNMMNIRGPGSPISPQSVMMVSKFAGHDHDGMDKMMQFFPEMGSRSPSASPVASKQVKSTITKLSSFHESSPSIHMFTAKPAEEILFPILRAILPAGNNPMGIADRVLKDVVDDVLVHQIGLLKHHEDEDEDIFFGFMGRRRVVLARMWNPTPSIDHSYVLFCADKEQADQFLLALRSFHIQVEGLHEM